MKIDITGVSNGDCKYSFSSFSKTDESSPGVSSQLTVTEESNPDFTYKAGTGDEGVSGVNTHSWVEIKAPNINSSSNEGIFKMSTGVVFDSSTHTEEIAFLVELEYCPVQITAASDQVIKMTQETEAQSSKSHTFSISNTATTCSESQVSVTNSTGGAPDPDIFDLIMTGTSSIEIVAKSALNADKTGVYELILREENKNDPSVSVQQTLEVTVIEILDCVPAQSTISPTSLSTDFFRYLVGKDQTMKIDLSGVTDGNCKFNSQFTLSCFYCGLTDSDAVKDHLTARIA